MINPKTKYLVRMINRDAETDEDVARANLVKCYQLKKDHYLIMEDSDFDVSYYLAPDSEAGTDVYRILHTAIAKTGMIALSRVVMAHREPVVAVAVYENGLIAHTPHEACDLNSQADVFSEMPNGKPNPEMVKLARQLMQRQVGSFDPTNGEDRYETRLREVIDAKLRGEGVEMEAPEEDRSNVIDLMAALKQSLGGTTKDKPKKRQKVEPELEPKAAPRKRSVAGKKP